MWDWVRGWVVGQALADGKPIPVQESGTAGGPQGQVATGDTSTGEVRGRAPGKGAGELGEYEPGVVSADPISAGRAVAPAGGVFDEATSVRSETESDETTDVFLNADGSRTAFVHAAPVNFESSAGKWAPIDDSLVGSAGEPLRPRAHGLGIKIGRSADANDLVSVAFDSAHEVGFGFTGGRAVSAKVDGDRAVFRSARAGLGLVEQPTNNGVKETLVLQSASAGTSWSFPLRLKGLTAKEAEDGSISLLNAKGAEVGQIPAGYAVDSSTPAPEPATTGVDYGLATSGGRTVLTVSIDPAWLNDPARVFPVYVDPTIATLSAWGYYETGTDSRWSNNLRIGTYDSGNTHKSRSYLALDRKSVV